MSTHDNCPNCGAEDSLVKDERVSDDGLYCTECHQGTDGEEN